MISPVSFSPHSLLPSRQLPLSLISLEDWVLITLNGPDSVQYLQNQLTCDISSLKMNRFSFAAHCDATGKMLSCLCVFYYNKSIAFIERRSVKDLNLTEMKKYAVFSKTVIAINDEVRLLGIAGFKVKTVLEKLFSNLPDSTNTVVNDHDTTLIFFKLPTPRFLLITTPEVCSALQKKLVDQAQFNDSRQWLSLDIESGYPIIDWTNSKKFIPQEVNVQALGGISFHKGCYIGQEIIARTKYHGVNKRRLYWLEGQSNYLPSAGEYLEIKIGSGWRRTGTILAACQLNNQIIWIQAVLNKNIGTKSSIRLPYDHNSKFITRTLPYAIDE